MSDSPTLSIVFGYRNREVERVQRCFDSLASQTFKDFEVLFVNYGSSPTVSRTIRALVEQYPFARYFYSDTRGHPWNRSRALNIGIRQASGRYILTTDIDLIFGPDVLEQSLERITSQTVLHLLPFLLPQDFVDWNHVQEYESNLKLGPQTMLGVFQLTTAEHLHKIHGFDEFYRYHGLEDRDLKQRLGLLGVKTEWLNGSTSAFHQWHPPGNYFVPGFMPDQVWLRMILHYYQQQSILERNNADQWGKIIPTEDRAILTYVDLEENRILESSQLHHFKENPLVPHTVFAMFQQFFDLPTGHALAIHHADTPQSLYLVDMLITLANRLLKRRESKARVGYSTNLAYDTLHYLIEQSPEFVSDYYLDIDGISVVVRA